MEQIGMNGPDLEERIASVVDPALGRARIPGLAVAVSSKGNRAVLSRGTAETGTGAPMSVEGRFQIGCITKMLTCLVAMQLAHEGHIDLDASLEEYLPDLAGNSARRGIRIRHLGMHTSGYRGLNPSRPEYGYFYAWPKFVEFFRGTEQLFQPGGVFNYEHTESVILGEVIKRISGYSCDSLIRERILDPLRLTAGSIERDRSEAGARVVDHSFDRSRGRYVPVRSVPYCSFWASSLSSMTMSAVDLMTLGEMLGGMRPVREICPEAINDVVRQGVELPRCAGGPERELSPRSFGFGCAQYENGTFGHNGSARGQTCGLRFSPNAGVVIVVALNCWNPHARDSLLDALLRVLLPGGVAEFVAPAARADLHLNEMEGTYRGCIQGLEAVVTRRDDRLIATVAGGGGGDGPRLDIEMAFDETGELRANCPVRHLSIGFFREASVGTPALLLGLNALKKVA